MRYRTYIFDLDGTLLDNSRSIMTALRKVITGAGLPLPSDQELRAFIGPPIIDSFMNVCKVDREGAEELFRSYRSVYTMEGTVVNPGVDRLLPWLKEHGAKLTVASLKLHDSAVSNLREMKIEQYFDAIVGINYKDINTKEETMEISMQKVGENDKSQVVMLGDTRFDALGAKNVGVDFVALIYGGAGFAPGEAEQYAPSFIARSGEELFRYFTE